MHERDRELLARLSAVNRDCGEITLRLLTMQPDDQAYAMGLLHLGRAFSNLGDQLTARALELDDQLAAAEDWPALPGPDQPGS